MPRKGQINLHCKYGHLKAGDNLLLRPRVINNRYEYVERVCKICLDRQKRDYDARQNGKKMLYQERIISQRLKREILKEL